MRTLPAAARPSTGRRHNRLRGVFYWAGALALALGCVVQGRAAGASPPPLREVIVVFKTHFDIGYTDLASNVVARYRTAMIDQALEVCDQNRSLPPERRFIWTLPGWPAAKICEDWPGQTPERRRRLAAAMAEGRFVVHGLPFTTHTELLEPEDLVRGLAFSARLSRQAGLPLPRDAKMTDVPSHSWILPSLLRHAGIEFLHLGCNAASRSPEVPSLFWWEGPDGSRLLTFYTAESYGTGLVPPAGWAHPVWLALIHTGDNHGPPAPAEIQTLMAEAAQKLPGVRVRIGRLSDFSDALLKTAPVLPVVRGDMPDTWIHGPLADPQGAALARNTRPLIGAADALHTLLEGWVRDAGSPVAPPTVADAIAPAYEKSLLYGEHTWGGALYWVTQYGAKLNWSYGEPWRQDRARGRFARLESSWAEHTSYIESARRVLQPALDANLAFLARSVRVEGPRVVVFNPLPWSRDGVVQSDLAAAGPCLLAPVGGGTAVPGDAVDGRLQFVARDVPAFGYRSYQITARRPAAAPGLALDPAAGILENTWFRVVLDPARGSIRSLVDKRTGRDWVDPAAPHGLGQYLYERFDSNQVRSFVDAYVKIKADWGEAELGKPALPSAAEAPRQAVTPAGCRMSCASNAFSVWATLSVPAGKGLPQPAALTIVLYAALPCVDLEIALDGKPADPWPEAGWMCLPFKMDAPEFRLGRLGGIVDPARDLVPGAGHYLFGLHTGVTLAGADGQGVGICPLDTPLASLDSPGLWQYSRAARPRRPAVYLNLFNNQWTTNFRLWNQGTIRSRARLWTFREPGAAAALVTPAWEARLPLLAASAQGAPGRLPAAQRGLELSRPGVFVSAFGPSPDGPGLVLRLWEEAGQSGPCEVRLPAGCAAGQAQPVDLRGQPAGAPVRITNGVFSIPIHSNAPASFLLGAAGRGV